MGCNVICITPNRGQYICLDSCIDNELCFCFLCTLLYHYIFSMCCTYFSQLDSLLMTKFNLVSFSYPFKLIMPSDYG